MDKNPENSQKTDKKEKFIEFFEKINPYREIRRNPEDGFVLDKKLFVYYSQFIQWIVNIIVNGFFANITLWTVHWQALHPVLMVADGIIVWFIGVLVYKVWKEYIRGKKEIERYISR